MNTHSTKYPIAILGLFLLASGSIACSRDENRAVEGAVAEAHTGELDTRESIVTLSEEAARNAGIETVEVAETIFASEIETTGEVDFDRTRTAHVNPRIAGRVAKVSAALGEAVRAGQPLATIDSIELGQAKSVFLQARSRFQLAGEILALEETLYGDRISSQKEVLTARAGAREAEAALRAAEETLHLYGVTDAQVGALKHDDASASLYTLRAPFGAKVVELHATRGELVTPETNLFKVADLTKVWVWIDVFERDLSRVHVEDEVVASVDAYPDETFSGRVSFVSSQVDPATRTIRARVDVMNENEKLRPGMFARVRVSETHDELGRAEQSRSLVVPESAVQRDDDAFMVFVSLGEDRFELRPVRTGRKAVGRIEILEGLQSGDQVVVKGAFILKSEASKAAIGEGDSH